MGFVAEVDGLKRKLTSSLSPTSRSLITEWEVLVLHYTMVATDAQWLPRHALYHGQNSLLLLLVIPHTSAYLMWHFVVYVPALWPGCYLIQTICIHVCMSAQLLHDSHHLWLLMHAVLQSIMLFAMSSATAMAIDWGMCGHILAS